MKFNKVIALSIAMLTVAGAQAGWLDQIGGMLGTQQPAPTPVQLGQVPLAGQSTEAASIATVKNNVTQIIAKVQAMIPAVTAAVTTQNFSNVAALAAPAQELLALGMSTAKSIQQLVATYPQDKGVIAGIVSQLNPVIAPLAAQIRTMAASAGFGSSFVLKTIASGLEQVPALLTSATR
ncbi:hypothetical protein BH09DEP1_BH09DEP1_1650 [soil metagenome]